MINLDQLDAEHDIIHFGGIQVRVNGVGNLRPTFYNLDQDVSQSLVPLAMQQGGGIELFRLANFNSQRAFLKLETTAIDETFKINRVIVFAKPIWTAYPA